MAELIAIGYDDETTASAAAEVDRLSRDLIIEPDAEKQLQEALHGEPVTA